MFIWIDNRSPVLGNSRWKGRWPGNLEATFHIMDIWQPTSSYIMVQQPHPVAPQSPSVCLAPSANTNSMSGSLGLLLVASSALPLLLFPSLQLPFYPSINLGSTGFKLIISIWQQLSNRIMGNNKNLYFLIRWRQIMALEQRLIIYTLLCVYYKPVSTYLFILGL